MAEIFNFPSGDDQFWSELKKGMRDVLLRRVGTTGPVEWAIDHLRDRLRRLSLDLAFPVDVSPDDLATPEALTALLRRVIQQARGPLFIAAILAEVELFNSLAGRYPRPGAPSAEDGDNSDKS